MAISGDMVFVISVWTMKDSWRAGVSKTDQTELVTDGIYQISRNPAFLGFDLVYVGILNRDTLSFILNQKVVVRSLKQMIERQPLTFSGEDTESKRFVMIKTFESERGKEYTSSRGLKKNNGERGFRQMYCCLKRCK